MAFEGMDPVVIKDISGKMDTQAKALQNVLTVVQAQVDRARSSWRGPAADHFEAGWNSQHKPALVTAHDQLSTMSALLKSEATAQTVTSDEISGAGGGSGALPIGGGGSGAPGNPTGAGGPDGPGGDKGDDGGIEPLKPIDKVLWGIGAPFLAASAGALGRVGYDGVKGIQDLATARGIFNQGAQTLADEVKAGTITQSEASASLTELSKNLNDAGDDVTDSMSKAYKFLGDGGLPELAGNAGKLLGGLGVVGGVAGIFGDERTLLDDKSSTSQQIAAIANIGGTAVTLPAAIAAATGTELTGAFAAGALVPGVGEVVLLGSAAYLAYTQIGWVHDGVNAAAKGAYDGVKWVGQQEVNLTKDAVSGVEDLGKGAISVASSAASSVGSTLSSAGSSVKHFLGGL